MWRRANPGNRSKAECWLDCPAVVAEIEEEPRPNADDEHASAAQVHSNSSAPATTALQELFWQAASDSVELNSGNNPFVPRQNGASASSPPLMLPAPAIPPAPPAPSAITAAPPLTLPAPAILPVPPTMLPPPAIPPAPPAPPAIPEQFCDLEAIFSTQDLPMERLAYRHWRINVQSKLNPIGSRPLAIEASSMEAVTAHFWTYLQAISSGENWVAGLPEGVQVFDVSLRSLVNHPFDRRVRM